MNKLRLISITKYEGDSEWIVQTVRDDLIEREYITSEWWADTIVHQMNKDQRKVFPQWSCDVTLSEAGITLTYSYLTSNGSLGGIS